MPLNKLENFIKNAEGRILYVNPNDLDSTDGVENQGNSLTKPFKTIQRALIESARFSYLRGEDNDIVEKTTILVFPGEHLIDNRPGYAIQDIGNNAISVAPNGAQTNAQSELTLTLNSNFDLTQENNILYKFNSVYGGIIIPRGTSIVGLDLRKTKVRPKYVPNPTDDTVRQSAIFRITGACYFWQFTFFDGDESGLVYTDPKDFSENNRSKPVFSHHKVTCFEYADGVNLVGGYQLTDLDMYYSKISNAFNRASGREIDQKYPSQAESFSKQRPEWEIVGAFGADPVKISNIISGDGATPGTIVTVTTQIAHELSAGTPVKIRGISEPDYNISTKVVQVLDETRFTYALPFVRANLPAGQPAGLSIGSNASVTIETDTVSGASPYIFNVSLRSVYGMQGMHADGSKADGFRSMVVAQFTAVSLQKDDRAFVKYNKSNRQWQGINYKTRSGDELSAESSNSNQVLHLSSDAVYREGWKTVHIKMSNDSVVQVVSVFAIGFHLHFLADSGGDASITNSNSNFGQFSLGAEGFKRDAFTKDDKGYITNIIAPRSVSNSEFEVEWVQFDVSRTKSINRANRIYLLGYTAEDVPPPIISQGFRIGAKVDDEVFLDADTNAGKILMTNGPLDLNTNTIAGTDTSAKIYRDVTITTPVAQSPTQMVFNCTASHDLKNGESIRIFSENGDLPEGLEEESVYFAITLEKNGTRADGMSLNGTQFQVASSKTNAEAQTPIYIPVYLGSEIRVESRVSDKEAGELGHPIQYDSATRSITNVETSAVTNETAGWFIHCENNSPLFQHVITLSNNDSEITYVKRKADDRSLDEKLYRMRYVVPKELDNTRDPVNGFILQDSSTVNVRETSDFKLTDIGRSDYDFDRNPRFITTCTYDNGANLITIRADKPHNLKNEDVVIISDVVSSTNGAASKDFGFNGTFNVEDIVDDKTFTVNDVDISGVTHDPGNILNDTNVRNKVLPRFKRNNNNENFYLYRTEVIKPYIQNVQDGVYYLYVLNSGNAIGSEFVNSKYSQKVTNLYPQLDRDNVDDNPTSAVSLAKRNPIGEVVTNDLKRSITRETLDKFVDSFSLGNKITSVVDSGASAVIVFDDEHQLNGLNSYTTLNGGSGHIDGDYFNVRLFNNNAAPSNAMWDGATADVTVSSGAVTIATIKEPGSGYTPSETLYFDSSTIGGTPSANIVTTLSGISTATADYVQITGIGTATDGYYRISDSSSKKQLTIAKTANDPVIISGQYAMVIGRVGIVAANGVTTPTTGIEQIVTTEGHGLVVGNKVRLTDASNGLVGDFIVNNATYNTFQVSSTTSLSTTKHVLKHGFSANNASADSLGENLGTRGIPNYDNEVLFLGQSITTEENFIANLPTGASEVIARFPLGSYLQIGNEIMRLKSTTLIGGGNNEIQVIRGSMGTIIEPHANGAQIKKIKLAPIELRRPSILRASGHTFEYLGYGPGNYSTGLPQVQVKTLSEKEEFLSQAQETSCGTVLYTGMDSDGDFYIGNTKYSAQSGEQTTFDVPTPTVTGEDPNRLSVVFDEVIVKERILVEGGKSKQILSQFDGPITFNGDVRMNKKLVLNNDLRVIGRVDFQNTNDATSCTDANAALRVQGGVAIGKKLFVCGDVDFGGNLQLDGTLTVNGTSKLTGEVTVDTGIVPDTDEGAYLGTAAKPFSEAHIDEIRIGVSGDNEIDTATGNLELDSASGTTRVDDNLVVTGNLDVDGTTELDGLNVAGNTTLDATTIDGTLTVNGSGNFGGNTVTASRFAGTADKSDTIRVNGLGNAFGPHYLLLQEGTAPGGHYTTARVDSGLSYDSANNDLRLLGDLVAFVSDDRVKTDKAPLDDALAKVCSLSGFTYNFNENGAELGFPTDRRHVGVSAQEVQKVLPEAVKTRDDDYFTVQYEKIVPLLIEAIKELSDKVSTLEDKLNK
jgi:cytoskeletal protein CcmA (bactofilin family)